MEIDWRSQDLYDLTPSRHEQSVELGDPGSRKILQVVEDLNKMTNNLGRKAVQQLKSCPYK